MKLTDCQRQAIEYEGADLQLIACAGSGKTEVVARRVVQVLRSGPNGALAPRNIIAFTFTDKAAAELKERIITSEGIVSDFETIHYHSKPAEKYESFANFLQHRAEDAYPEGWQDNQYANPDAVRIMTVHQAKGMQWPVVFIPALLKNRFPARKPGGRTVWHLLPRAGVASVVFSFSNLKYFLVRRIDTGETTIVDLKSTDRAQPEHVTEAQLHVYALGYQELTGRRPGGMPQALRGPEFAEAKGKQFSAGSLFDKVRNI